METSVPGGYAGKILRVDLTNERIWTEPLDARDVPSPIWAAWASAPKSCGKKCRRRCTGIIRTIGWFWPLARSPGLPVWGTGGLTVVTRGAMTNGATNTQANGFFGANLKIFGL